VTRVQNSSRYTEILLYSPRFRSNCRHFSRFDFHACRASISKVNRRHTSFFPLPDLLLFANGRNRRYMYVFRLASYRRPSNIPAISWHRELLPRFLIFLMQECTCGIIVHARSLWFCGISPGWSNDMQSRAQLCVIWHFTFFILYLSFLWSLCGRMRSL